MGDTDPGHEHPEQKSHLMVLCHGLWGDTNHMESIETLIKSTHPQLIVLNLADNRGIATYDGIDVCAKRAMREIAPHLSTSDRISFVGYSLGGLILRYLIGLMQLDGTFDRVSPIYYISFATPHLGTHKPFMSGHVFNAAQSVFLYRVGNQFSVSDSTALQSRPLLLVMADPDLSFMKGLGRFRQRILLANTQNDRSVRFTTANISMTNPYTRFQKRVVDAKYPSIIEVTDQILVIPPTSSQDIALSAARTAMFILVLPLWFVIAGTVLTTMSMRARINAISIPVEDTLAHEEITENSGNDSLSSSENDEIPQHLTVRNERAYMIRNLNNLAWTKIHTSIETWNSHATIVQRVVRGEDYAGYDVIRFVFQELIKNL